MPLERLLKWAAQGFCLFPLATNTKLPIKGSKGLLDATANQDQIEFWHEIYPTANWAVNCGMSGLLVVDLDTKRGKDGVAAWDALKRPGIDPVRVITPSKGYHLYFKGKARSTANEIADGIDTRGEGGYVLLPGSVIDGVAYERQPGGRIDLAPEWLLALLTPKAKPEKPTPTTIPVDSPAMVADVVAYLQSVAPIAIEGQGGDSTTLQVALRCKDLGVSEPTTLDLMSRFWNDRCEPPWEWDALEKKVENAYKYGRNAVGSSTPEGAFTPIDTPVEESKDFAAIFASDITEDIPKRPWILGRRLIAGFVTLTIAPGGVGKSTLTLLEGLAVACGRNLTGDEVYKTGAVWLYNTEDPLCELKRRAIAAMNYHRIEKEDRNKIIITSGVEEPLVIAASARGEVAINERQIQKAVDFIIKNKILVWIVDPFVEAHRCEENSNNEMAMVVQQFKRIASATQCAISLVHHTRKKGNVGGDGDMDMARGAGSVVNAARIVHTLGGMSPKEAEAYHLTEDVRPWYVRLDDAKGNMAPPAEGVRWFRKIDYVLPNGDHVGTIEPAKLTKIIEETLSPIVEAVFTAVGKGRLEAGYFELEEVGDVIKAYCGVKAKDERIVKTLREAFTGSPILRNGVNILLVQRGKKDVLHIITKEETPEDIAAAL